MREAMPEPVDIGRGHEVPAFRNAVYVAVGLDGEVLYVGSTARISENALKKRIREHSQRPGRFARWSLLYVVPLMDSTPLTAVRQIEGRVGAHLGPKESKALPRIGKRD